MNGVAKMPKLGMQPIRRRQLIDATLDAINEVGMHDATIAQIARRAGVSTGIISHYFKDKNGLLEATMRDITSQLRDAVLNRLHALPDGSASLADITLHTGRTHQIRVQFASRRHPLWGDGKYGSRIKGDIALQSARLRFIHPDTGKVMDFRLPVPGTWPAWGIRQENDNGTTV
jgi:AcrR family transcriptional regulator